LCCRYTSTKTRPEALTDKEEACELRRSARVSLAHLSSDPKYSNALPLRLRAACVPHALHPTDEFDAPSVRKDTQPESTRVQPPQGVPTFQPREYRASSPRFACALELGSKWEGPKAVVGQGSKENNTDKRRDHMIPHQVTRVISHKIDTVIHGTKSNAW
jgi:hypothetical protein